MTTEFVQFDLERLLSTFEKTVDYNLSESGVQPLTLRGLMALKGGDADKAVLKLADIELDYPQANGNLELRERIAALYPGAAPENVLVTVGAIQANLTALLAVTDPGDKIAVMQPNYQQFWGLAQNLGREMQTFNLKEQRSWALDLDELQDAVGPGTKFVAIVNPNNPTGRIMTTKERAAVVDAAARTGAYLLADEVYAGAERTTDEITPTLYGDYDKVLAVNSLSKAYGLPGTRLGWIVGPADVIERLWAWQDYLTICAGVLGNRIAAVALSKSVRPKILKRTRGYVRRGFENVERWAAARDDVDVLPPDAAAICFVRYRKEIASADLVQRLIDEKSTFVAPGSLFGLEHCLRISFGLPDDYVNEGLRRLGALLDAVE